MSNIVLKDRQGTKQTYSGVEVMKIADSEGNYNNYVAEPTGDIKITANGSVDVSKYASAMVAVPSGTAEEWDGTGVVITPITPEASPSITIDGATYNVVKGMTWFTWASNEEYNTDNFQCLTVDSKVFVAEREDYVIDSEGNAVYGEDLITVGGVYSIEEATTTDELAGTWVFNEVVTLTKFNLGKDILVNGVFYGPLNYSLVLGHRDINHIYMSNYPIGRTGIAVNSNYGYPQGVTYIEDNKVDYVWYNSSSDYNITGVTAGDDYTLARTIAINDTYAELVAANGQDLAEKFLYELKANATKQ